MLRVKKEGDASPVICASPTRTHTHNTPTPTTKDFAAAFCSVPFYVFGIEQSNYRTRHQRLLLLRCVCSQRTSCDASPWLGPMPSNGARELTPSLAATCPSARSRVPDPSEPFAAALLLPFERKDNLRFVSGLPLLPRCD